MESLVTKSIVRKTALNYRKILASKEYKKRNSLIVSKLNDLLERKKVESIHVFLAIADNKEPDISPMLPLLWRRQVKTITSVTNFSKKEMYHYKLDSSTKLEPNHLRIPEPSNADSIGMDAIGAILVPLLVADKRGNRIGYGGGFYDKLLSKTKAIKIGLSLGNPVDEIKQTDDWDIPLNYLITPYKIYNYG